MGLHYGAPFYREVAPIVDYFGETINKASRIQNESEGNEVAVSDAFIAAIYEEFTGVSLPIGVLDDGLRQRILMSQFGGAFRVVLKGLKSLKGIAQPEYITMVRLRR